MPQHRCCCAPQRRSSSTHPPLPGLRLILTWLLRGLIGWLVQPLPPPAVQLWASVSPLMVGLVLLICKALPCLVLRSLGA